MEIIKTMFPGKRFPENGKSWNKTPWTFMKRNMNWHRRAAGWQSLGLGEEEGRLALTWKSGGPRPSPRPATSCPFEILSRSMSLLFVLKFWSPFEKLIVVLEPDKGWLCDLSKKSFFFTLLCLTEESQLSHPTSEKWSPFNDVYDKV